MLVPLTTSAPGEVEPLAEGLSDIVEFLWPECEKE